MTELPALDQQPTAAVDPYILTYINGAREEYPTADEWHAAYMRMQKRAEKRFRSTLHEMNLVSIGRYKLEKESQK